MALVTSREQDVLWHEAGAWAELAALWWDPAYTGRGLPRGDGRLVLVLPALLANDLYLAPLRAWLGRLGYRPVCSTLALHAGCPNRVRAQVEAALRARMRWQPGPVALVGHSRGGTLAWVLASRLQDEASHLVLLGSAAGALAEQLRRAPGTGLEALPVAPFVVEAGRRAQWLLDPGCRFPACDCPYPNDLRRPLSAATRVLSIYSREDPIVAPVACAVPGAAQREVGGSHGGLVYNRAVYPALAEFLAAAP